MNIKNWTVTTQRIKNKGDGLAEYASYLVSQKHQNHRETNIIPISGSFNSFVNNTIKETLEFDKNNKKGGRKVESYAQSFNFILPPPHKPTISQWENITKDLLVTLCNELNIKEKTNMALIDAIYHGAVLRLRPKLMTLFAILGGLIPIMYINSIGSEVMQRVAAPMIGGMLSSTILTLIIIPAIFYLVILKKDKIID